MNTTRKIIVAALLLALAWLSPLSEPSVPQPSFVVTCPFPVFRIDESSDLVNWSPRYYSTNQTAVVIFDCGPGVEKRFFRVVPLTTFSLR